MTKKIFYTGGHSQVTETEKTMVPDSITMEVSIFIIEVDKRIEIIR